MPFLFSKIEDARDHILTGILLVAAIALMVIRHDGGLQNTRILAITVMSYLEQPLSAVRVYRTALQTNTELHRENIILLDELSRLRSASEQNEELRRLLEFRTDYRSRNELVPVWITSKNLTGFRNSLTINAGKSSGLDVGMPVVNSKGLIGRVLLTANDYSLVMPLNNTLFRVSASIQGSRAYGIVSWSGSGSEMIMNYVPQTIEVKIGDVVETSGASNQFPPNIPIGHVTRFYPEPGRDTQRIFVEPLVDINTIAEAFVIKFQVVPSIDSLVTEFERLN